MPAANTRITTEVDYSRHGKQITFLRVPHSDNEHAFAFIPVPIAIVANGEGPTVLLVAGTHGDEYEGQIILRRLIEELQPKDVRGRIIVLPAVNYLAAQTGKRCWPGDGVNMNRAYPGDPDVTPTAALAHYIESVMLPLCDFGLDLHSGGHDSEFLPCVYLRKHGGEDMMRQKVEATEAFAAPLTVVVGATSDNRSLLAAGDRHSVPMLATELGGMASISLDALNIGRAGVLRVLHHLGSLAANPDDSNRVTTRHVEYKDQGAFTYSSVDGVFEPAARLGDHVQAGDLAGRVYSHQDARRPAVDIHFDGPGMVVCRRVPAQVKCGDYVFAVATDVARDSLTQKGGKSKMTAGHELERRLADGEVILLDGAIGTQLQQMGAPMNNTRLGGGGTQHPSVHHSPPARELHQSRRRRHHCELLFKRPP